MNNLGSILIISVAIGIIWDLAGRRSFAREIMDLNNADASIEIAGIRKIGTRWSDDPDWDELFRNARELDIFVANGETWRNTYRPQLGEMARRKGTRINVYLADPGHLETMTMLATRFNRTPDDLASRIVRAKNDFLGMQSRGGGGQIQVFYYQGDRLFSIHRFDNKAVITFYSHAKARSEFVPTLVCEAGGSFFAFLQTELDAIKLHSVPAD